MFLPGTLAYEDLRFHILFNILKETIKIIWQTPMSCTSGFYLNYSWQRNYSMAQNLGNITK
jgi:hypothetical protein